MDQITNSLQTEITDKTRTMMVKQNVPREKFADGIDLEIYRRCGGGQCIAYTLCRGMLALNMMRYVIGNIDLRHLSLSTKTYLLTLVRNLTMLITPCRDVTM